jgi:hypothetical protein
MYLGGPGGGVEIGRPGYRERYDRGYRRYHGYAYERGRGCRTVTIERDDGRLRKIRRCRLACDYALGNVRFAAPN